jgi:hypothetical protein
MLGGINNINCIEQQLLQYPTGNDTFIESLEGVFVGEYDNT